MQLVCLFAVFFEYGGLFTVCVDTGSVDKTIEVNASSMSPTNSFRLRVREE